MYAYLNGKLAEKAATSVILDVNGVGYQIQIPLSTYEALPVLGQAVRLLTHFVVREDVQALYGFYTEAERDLFKLLLSVTGIGPKMSLTILSGISLSQLRRAIVDGEIDTLKQISGVGKKTAERIIVELREKLVLQGDHHSQEAAVPGRKGDEALIEDSLEALVALGYRKQNAKAAIDKVLKDQKPEKISVEALIRASLKYF